LAHAIIAIDVGDVIRPGIFVDPRIVKHRRVIDAIPIHGYGKNTKIRRWRIDCPRNGNQFATSSNTRATSAGRKDGISQAAGVPIEHDVLDCTNFFSLGGFHFGADELTGLDVSGVAARRSALGLG
jgi:hypothetical protein